MKVAKVANPNVYFNEAKQKVLTDSVMVSKAYGVKHSFVIETIEKILDLVSINFGAGIFTKREYLDEEYERSKMYEMTKDGLLLLVSGFEGKKVFDTTILYIKAFDYYQRIKVDEVNAALINELIDALEAEKRSFTLGKKAGEAIQRLKH